MDHWLALRPLLPSMEAFRCHPFSSKFFLQMVRRTVCAGSVSLMDAGVQLEGGGGHCHGFDYG